MDASRAQTEGLLQQFNLNFQQSRNEMIERFLADQNNLNKKFAEYSLLSDDEDNGGKERDSLQRGITIDDINQKYGQGKKGQHHSDDQDSLNSLMTELSFSDNEERSVVPAVKNSQSENPITRSSSSRKKALCDKTFLDNDERSTVKMNQSGRPTTTRSTSSRKKALCDKPQTTVTVTKSSIKNSAFNDKKSDTGIKNFKSETKIMERSQSPRPLSSSSRSREEVCQKLSLSTPRFGVPERSKDKIIGRSKSLRVPSTKHSTVISHPEQPPNSPEIARKDANQDIGKPPLDNIKVGRKEKQEKPKKLLTKRFIRPKTAMGLTSDRGGMLTFMQEPEPMTRFQRKNPSSWDDTETTRTTVSVRSAPLPMRHIISWEQSDFSNDETLNNNALQRPLSARSKNKVPPLPLSVTSSRDSKSQPSYAKNTDIISKQSPRISKSKNIHIKPFVKSNSDYFPISNIDGNKASNNSIMEIETMNFVDNTPSNISSGLKQESGTLRRYKGHGNLTGATRGTQLAVLKLPPVKKKSRSELPSRSSTSMGYFGKETTVMKMMPVHIVEEF